MMITSVSSSIDKLPPTKLRAVEIMVRLHHIFEPIALIPAEYRYEEINQAIDAYLQLKRDVWGAKQ